MTANLTRPSSAMLGRNFTACPRLGLEPCHDSAEIRRICSHSAGRCAEVDPKSIRRPMLERILIVCAEANLVASNVLLHWPTNAGFQTLYAKLASYRSRKGVVPLVRMP